MTCSPRPCSITECGKLVFARQFCSQHYARWKRHGDPLHAAYSTIRGVPQKKCAEGCACGKHKAGWAAKTKYTLLFGQHDHPIASKGGWLYEHRKVLYGTVGPGSHPCYWCGVVLSWGGLDGIIADHLNRNKKDNRPENLVPSCHTCNVSRVGDGTEVCLTRLDDEDGDR